MIETKGLFEFEIEPQPYKNFMVFVSMDYAKSGVELRGGDTDYSKMENTFNLIKAQIDNSLDCQWDPKDIIIATNFEFEYRGVKTYVLDEICDYSQFFHKHYATLELMKKGVFEGQNIWYHDLDAFQLEPFNFPYFGGDWGTCVYPGGDGHSLQCGVIYLKPSSQDIFEHLVTNMKNKRYNTHCDEQVTRMDVKLNPKFSSRVSILDTSYNMGMTGFEERYHGAVKPIKVIHFSPNKLKDWDYFAEGENPLNIKLVDNRLKNILIKNKVNWTNQDEKIFCLGLSKTGTKSFAIAMRELGYTSCHNGGRNLTPELLEKYDSFSESKTCWVEYKKLSTLYPNSKFILSYRDKEEWADRIIEWYNPKFKISYIDWHKNGNYNDKKLDTKEELMDFYQEHYDNVKLYFKNNLLVHNVFENDGYDTLCKFLNKEIPTNSYPTLKNEKVKN